MGVGACLMAIITVDFEVEVTDDCPCKEYAAKLDGWGPDLCEARIDEIADHLAAEARVWGWRARLSWAIKGVQKGWATRLSPFAPYSGIVAEAIKRSRLSG